MALILVCDVPSPFRDALERALEALGHRVLSAPDPTALVNSYLGQAGQVRAEPGGRAAADCVLLDETAVGSTSALFSTALRLRGADKAAQGMPLPQGVPGVPIIAVINKQEPEARAAALQIVDDVVSRPAHLVEVVARIEALLRGRGAQVAAPAVALEDGATGLRSRAFLDERVGEEWRRATRFTEPMALLLVGLEGASGKPPQSDRALREVAIALRRALRQIDVLGRFAQYELAALLVNTHLAGALTCAERLRRELGAVDAGIEIAIGLSLFPGKDVTSGAELIRVAERALERARSEGPGSICLIQHQGYLFQQR